MAGIPDMRKALVFLGTVTALAMLATGLGLRLIVLQAAGTVSLTTFDTAYTQDFNTLASSGTANVTVPAGWEFSESGTNGNTTYRAGTGSDTTGDSYSFGAASQTERAFGGLRSGSLVPLFGAQFTNNTGGTITGLAIAFTGEQWRLGQNTTNRASDRLDFQLSTDATSLTTGAWTDYDSLDFTSPVVAGTVGALNGNASPNRTPIRFTITGLSISNGATFWVRWADSDLVPGSDDGLAVDDFSLTATGTMPVTDAAPTVASLVPGPGATAAPNANISVTFSEPVNVSGSWFTLNCSATGAHAAAVSGGPTSFTIDPSVNLADGETCTLTVIGANVSDQDNLDPPDGMAGDFVSTFGIVGPCSQSYTPIPSIQGRGASVAITGPVTTKGVVVGDYEGASPSLRGFFIQDLAGDGDPSTSDGLFVFEGSNANTVDLGDVVVVTGNAGENQGQSQVSVGTISKCGTGSIASTDVTLPLASADDLERYEGMLVRLPQTLYVTEHYQLGRFGQVVLSSAERLAQPTDVTTPGDAALALQAANDLNQIILDDDSQAQNPASILFARGGQPLSASNTLRGGDQATGIVGVLNYTWGGNAASPNAYRVRPINALNGYVSFEPANARPATPPNAGGTLRVASANLLNYFNTFGDNNCTGGLGGSATDCRGASMQGEFDRQWPKSVAAILGTGADVIGLTEMENDGYGADSAIQHLLDKLNAATAPGTWAFIDVDAATGQVNAAGTDAIKSAIFYKPAKVTPVGTTAALNTVEFVNGGNSKPGGRPSLAQAFLENASGASFVLVVNHFRSRGSACDVADAKDGQGNCSAVRTYAAGVLAGWLATNPTGTYTPNMLLVGDFNAYTKEDPLTVLKNAGYRNLVEDLGGGYSYAFDAQWGSLDHALASAGFAGHVKAATPFHINADEPAILDYTTDFKSSGQLTTLYAPDMFRAADHDPLVVDVGLENQAPVIERVSGPITIKQSESVTLEAAGYDPDGGPVTYAWDLDNDGTFETPGQTALFSGAGKFGSFTVKVRVTDVAGLAAVAATTVTVHFDWQGFFSPLRNDPQWNVVKAGSAVPFKFGLGGDQGLDVFKVGFPVSLPIGCDTGETSDTQTATASPGHSALSFDGAQYTYVWKTDKSWTGTCRLVVVTLVDGSSHLALFRFGK